MVCCVMSHYSLPSPCLVYAGCTGFAFVEFYSVSDAMTWMEDNRVSVQTRRGWCILQDVHFNVILIAAITVQDSFRLLGEKVSLEYCRQRKSWDGKDARASRDGREYEGDWSCFKVELCPGMMVHIYCVGIGDTHKHTDLMLLTHCKYNIVLGQSRLFRVAVDQSTRDVQKLNLLPY